MDIIIFGGQSNMQGQTESLPKKNDEIERALEYRYLTDELVPLKHPVGEDLEGAVPCLGAHLGHGSLVPAFCKSYIEKTGRQVVAIHAARGATVVGEWLHGTQLAYCSRQKISAGIEKVKERYDVDRIYYVWLQGESDTIINTEAEEYFERLIELKNQLKARFNINKFGIIKVGYFGNDERSEIIMSAQERAVETDKDFVMLTRVCPLLSKRSEYINPYAEGHYNNDAMKIIGTEAGIALAEC